MGDAPDMAPEEPPVLRRGVKPSNWQSERQRWRELHEDAPPPLVRSRHSANFHSERHPKVSFSERERLRKAGDLVEPQLNSFDLQPPVAHRVKNTVTFSERQRRRKRLGNNNGFSLSENECFDSVDQLFPGARADYNDSPVMSRQSLVDSWSAGFRQFLEERGNFGLSSSSRELATSATDVGPGFSTQPFEESESETEKEDDLGLQETVPKQKKKEMQFRFRLKLGANGRRLLSGAIAGAFSRTAVAPLETVRTHLMVGSHGHSVSEVFNWIMGNEGWQGLFRGNAINVLRVAPSKAIELFAFEKVKGFLNSREGLPAPLAALPVSPIAGSCAGISSTIVMYPLELLKTRLTIQVSITQGFVSCLYLSSEIFHSDVV
ncbi:hypothetical protein KC19_8G131100 [Ceratodon purpureus]|uniref:Uncharacterized protein n=1 Tax=Ceratodon purpureus TaxID=3225 RepID=A0A8T0H1T2_CERPU|nr:hypothetical protein KC19_8G131100 [Ceratodon purpureus]